MGMPGSSPAMALRADCSRCAGLCCVALPFSAAAGFPSDKDAGTPCTHLDETFRCRVHAEFRPRGFVGCAVFDCFGAGQRITAAAGDDVSWRDDPELARRTFAAFGVARHLHEVLWYLAEGRTLTDDPRLRARLLSEYERIDALAGADADAVAATDVAAARQAVGPLLAEVSDLVRGRGHDRRGADLAGARLRDASLRGTTFRGALLIAADLRGADLRVCDFLGADLRDADLRSADLTGAFFLTQPQVNAARGDAATLLPPAVAHPAHW
ncbi:hypothetical protein B1813_08205 [Saccharomonospora piscinae]|uniref:Low-complexity protein n=2 Tax=Saccharomonospora piscinae TaxID=687388 RepID=A0A1V9A559_SACPI|nr:pentapeptide repeat-containing protein [Saccharomonospora piscinae]OQO92211.1 hypothetical protein B1813_08205 [Saccharomonospora piscinae]